MDFPKVRGAFLRVPIVRTIIFRGLHWGPHVRGNHHVVPFLGVPTFSVQLGYFSKELRHFGLYNSV